MDTNILILKADILISHENVNRLILMGSNSVLYSFISLLRRFKSKKKGLRNTAKYLKLSHKIFWDCFGRDRPYNRRNTVAILHCVFWEVN